jgi:hypothetical protein
VSIKIATVKLANFLDTDFPLFAMYLATRPGTPPGVVDPWQHSSTFGVTSQSVIAVQAPTHGIVPCHRVAGLSAVATMIGG